VVESDAARPCVHVAAPAVHDQSTTPWDRAGRVLLHRGVPPIAAIEWVTHDDTCGTIDLLKAHHHDDGVRADAAVRRRWLPSLTDATTTCYY